MDSIKEELQQTKQFKQELIISILNSKRLLSDHVDLLEECITDHLVFPKSNIFTFNKLLALSVTSIVIYVHVKNNRLSSAWPTMCASYAGFYFTKLYKSSQNRKKMLHLRNLLKSIDSFEANIKKNIMFLNERTFLKASSKTDGVLAKDKQVLENCLTAITETIFTIYKNLKILEEGYKIPENYEAVYQSFENIEDCEILKTSLAELGLHNVKDFYNIFAYIQSQYLYRVGLVLFHSPNIDDTKLCSQFLASLSENLVEKSIKMTKMIEGKPADKLKVLDTVPSNVLPAPLIDLRKSSVQFSMKMAALLHEFQHLDTNLQTVLLSNAAAGGQDLLKNELSTLQTKFKTIATELPVLQDDYQRLFINFQRFLNITVEQPQPALQLVEQEKPNKVYSGDTVDQQSDDFFAVDGFSDSDMSANDDNDEQRRQKDGEDLENVNSKVAKRYFQPVLKQLKQKIEPLGEAMKERERKVLKAKGIEVVEASDLKESVQADDYSGDSDGSDYSSDRRMQRKMKKSDNRYSDVRDFLANKEQVNIFMMKPMPAVVTEDVLE